jgi:Fe2+ or Zn2+ uptake regulation protein
MRMRAIMTVYRHLRLLADDHVIDALHTSTMARSPTAIARPATTTTTSLPTLRDERRGGLPPTSRLGVARGRVGFAAPSHRVEVFGTCPGCQGA